MNKSGIIPPNWKKATLGSLAQYLNGFAFKPSDWSNEGTKIIRIEQLNKPTGYYDYYLGSFPKENAIRDGDLIFSWSATLKVIIWKHGDAVLNQHLFKVVPYEHCDKAYLLYLLDFYMDELSGSSHGSTMKHIKRGDIDKFLVLLPESKYEQQKIAKVLSTIDNQIEQTQALIDKYTAIKQGMMTDLFSRGINPKTGELRPTKEQAPELYWKSELSWIPNDWRTSLLGEISELVRGSTPRPAKDPRYFNGNFAPWITVGELSKDKWPFLKGTSTKLTQEGTLFSRKLEKGTLVISNSGFGCGVPKILDIEGYANDGVAAFLNLDNSTDKLFLYYYLSFNTLELRKKVARGNDQPNLNTEMLSDYQIIFPAKAEQEVISERLLSMDKLINEFSNEKQKLQTQKQGLMQDLLTGNKSVDNLPDSILEL